MIWKKVPAVNSDYNIDLKSPAQFNNSNLVVQLNFEFTERVFVLDYTGVLDIMSKVGGLQASIMPIMRMVSPWIALSFMFQLSRIIRSKSEDDYKKFLLTFLIKVHT